MMIIISSSGDGNDKCLMILLSFISNTNNFMVIFSELNLFLQQVTSGTGLHSLLYNWSASKMACF